MQNSIIVLDENKNEVSSEFLKSIISTSKNENDFLNKVNYSITEEETTVSKENDKNIIEFYRSETSKAKLKDLKEAILSVTWTARR